MLMSDRDIQEAVNSKDLIIRNFSKKSLQPASYDMRVGEEAFSSHEKASIEIKSTSPLIIKPGDFILVRTYESVKLSPKIAGRIGLRSFHARKGLALLAGPQIDPGFEGVLVVGLHNLDANELKLSYREPFCTVEFYRLSEPVKQPYKGEYQSQNTIREQDSTAIKERIAAWAPIDDRLKRLEEKVERLTEKFLTPSVLTSSYAACKFFVEQVSQIPQVIAVYMGVSEGVIDLWTIVEGDLYEAETSIAKVETELLRRFPNLLFDSLVVPKKGRELDKIIPTNYMEIYRRVRS